LLLAFLIAIASWLPSERAAAANARSDQVILFLGRDFTGPTKTWSLKPNQPFLAVPYTGDEFRPVSASVKLGADVGVLLFEHPFFSTIDETCDYRLGDAADPELWWLSDKAMFVPGPQERGMVEGNMRPQEIASLILYRRALGPPPGALLLERRRYVNWDCSAPTKARGYRRVFVPIAAPPHRQGCFNLEVGLSYGSSGRVALDFSAASELLLIQPRDLTADYAQIDHRFTVGLHDDRDCAGAAATFSHPDAGARRFELKQFDFDRKARSVMLRYDQGAYDEMLLTADQEPEETGEAVVGTTSETDPEETPQEAQVETPEEPEVEMEAEPVAQASPEPVPEPETPAVADAAGSGEDAADGPEPKGDLIASAAASETGETETAPQMAPQTATEAASEAILETGESGVSANLEPESPTTTSIFTQAATPAATPAATNAPTTTSVLGEGESAASTGNLAPVGEAVSKADLPEAGELEAGEPMAGELEAGTPDAEAPQLEAPQLETPELEALELEALELEALELETLELEALELEALELETPQSETTGFLALPESEPEAVVAGQTFKYPLLQGFRLNACLYQQEDCGEEAASEWCKARGFAGGAISFEIDENIGSLFPTLALGDLRLCANFVCDGFKEITCLP
jgi:hypothetical protein